MNTETKRPLAPFWKNAALYCIAPGASTDDLITDVHCLFDVARSQLQNAIELHGNGETEAASALIGIRYLIDMGMGLICEIEARIEGVRNEP